MLNNHLIFYTEYLYNKLTQNISSFIFYFKGGYRMHILENACVGCGLCIPYCPVGALSLSDSRTVTVDRAECVECGACVRAEVCVNNALCFDDDMSWPRIVRRFFSDPNFSHSTTTKGMGRGTAEMKSNDVTGRYKIGEVGVGIELGRPNVGVWFKDIEIVTMHVKARLKELGIEFEEKNPLTVLMDDPEKGSFKKEFMNEKLLSAIVEFKTPAEKLPLVLQIIRELDGMVNTVFSVFIATRAEEDGSSPNIDSLKANACEVYPNAKINVGLGRPYFYGDESITSISSC
jgi:ferredoxin